MNDQLIRDLLHEVADDVEPGDRLGAIRAATAPAGRRTHRGWWAAGGAGLLAASIATAFALTTGGAPQGGEPDPASSGPTTATDGSSCCEVLPVYFVGDGSVGPRLYREFQTAPAPAATRALDAALRGDALDPDYGSVWPAGVAVDIFTMRSDLLTVSLEGDVRERPTGLSQDDARLAIEQLVRTAQGVYGHGRVPVRLLLDGQPAGEVLGVDTASPLGNLLDADVLAPVSLSDPSEGLEVDNDEPFTVRGRGSSPDGQVQLLVKRWEGTGVAADATLDVSSEAGRLTPYRMAFDLSDVPPGDYDVIATVQNADGTVDSDTRRITVVD